MVSLFDQMPSRTFACVCIIIYCSSAFPGNAESNSKTPQELALDELSENVLRTVSIKEANSLLPQILGRPFEKNEHREGVAEKKKRIPLKAQPTKEEIPTKKSIQPAVVMPAKNPVALHLALIEPYVYLTDNENKVVAPTRSQDYTSVKRFKIPQSANDPLRKFQVSTIKLQPQIKPRDIKGTKVPERYTKRQIEDDEDDEDDEDEQSPVADSITDDETSMGSVQQYSASMPTNSLEDQDVSARSGVNDINTNKLVTVLPLKVGTPVVMSGSPSVALTSTEPQVLTTVQGTERSALPIAKLVQPLQTQQSFETGPAAPLVSPQSDNPPLRLHENSNDVTTALLGHSGLSLMTQPEEKNPAIRLAHVPAREQNSVIKLAHVPVQILNSIRNTQKGETKTNIAAEERKKQKSGDINEETLRSLQLRLTSVISKLEGQLNKKKVKNNGTNKEVETSKLSKTAQTRVNEKSLLFLKKKLSRVLAKFKSKPSAGQPFTIGKEWSHLLDQKSFNQGGNVRISKKGSPSSTTSNEESKQDEEGIWPSIASQLLRKLNKALMKFQERRIAKSLAKNAVMYFNFDNAEASNSGNVVEDKSGQFNDATLSNRAHISSRTYGSCGKALILNSGNLRYFPKYFKDKPTKAITLAMWVRTNATGFVRWFARNSGPSREFSTSTQYPLVRKNVWTHLCGTFNSSTGITRIYVDGELKAEKVNGKRDDTIPADFTPAGIGSKFGDDNLIAVDEVYMFSRALSEKEVQVLYDDCEFNRMVLHYGFQKINRTAGVVFDQSGLNNNAVLRGEASILDSGCDKCGSCLDLNSKDNPRLTIQGSRFKHRPSKALSLAAWFNLNSTSGVHPLFEVDEAITKTPLLNLHATDGKLRWKGIDKNRNTIFDLNTEQSVVPEGIWVHVLATFNSFSGSAKIFVDGHQKAFVKTAKKVPIGEDWGETRVGGKAIGSQALGGYMDELALYNWELDSSEISYVMKYCPDHPKLVSFTVHVPLE